MTFIWLAISVLILFGILNLTVGLSNDAVNFLNSAIGTGVAKRKTVYWIAGAGIVFGTFISAGMMEVAGNGIIYTDKFYLTELLSVFMAAMLVNIVLIDAFNTFKFPTSTTIAVVFELIGGALAIALIKQHNTELGSFPISEIINTDKVLIILSGIIFSIVLSFLIGMIVQFLARLLFSFNYKNSYKVLFSVVGGLAITAISFMIFKKSVNGIFVSEDIWQQLIEQYLPQILITIFAGTTFIFLFLSLSFDFDISRLVVLFGTFALALSFAANDLVNFIGLPLAGLEGIKEFFEVGASNPDTFSLDFLNDTLLQKGTFKDITQLLIFSISAGIMVITLFCSKKARGVTETEVYLGRQLPGYERFESSYLSRIIVKTVLKIHSATTKHLPQGVMSFVTNRYKRDNDIASDNQVNEIIYFDTLRAIVNLTMAGLLISLGTYLKFPLSTTFVVFMVAMGTSLADMAWGRESAVYRVSGVIHILGGWILTAVLAFLGSLVLTFVVWYGKMWVVIPLVLMLFYILYKTTVFYRRRENQQKDIIDNNSKPEASLIEGMLISGDYSIKSLLIEVSKVYLLSVKSFFDNDLNNLHKTVSNAKRLTDQTRQSKSKLFDALVNSPDEDITTSNLLIPVLDYFTEMVKNISDISELLYKHLKNQHKEFTTSQRNEINILFDETSSFFNHLIHIIKEQRFDTIPELKNKQKLILLQIEDLRIAQLKRIKKGEGTAKANLLFIELLAESKNCLLYSMNFAKTYYRCAKYYKGKN